ncbi:hypothetical protein [Agromyces binzhouensis]|uniref:Uncharacterized protein n=1 Tax=Agromyces binzhouensis TaxID=1817495 RepID=A0A4Q2JYG3_9MICO|nr:hypothetical protein [Agromyces binzhouensis]RXZ51917.1 hypothetical protein ESO86_00225 [Agromyces binzhouensis]
MTEEPLNLLLATYDLDAQGHGRFKRLLRDEFGESGGRWIRVQSSVILVETAHTPEAFKDLFDIYVGVGNGSLFVADLSFSGYSGYGGKDGWAWLDEVRARRAATRAAQDAEFLEREAQEYDELYGDAELEVWIDPHGENARRIA